MINRTKFFLLLLVFSFTSHSQGIKTFFESPNDYYYISSDLHIHTVFSDGVVWPTLRVDEALRDSIDLISLTEHIEYQSHISDIPHENRNRSFQIAGGYVKNQPLAVVHGTEITKPMPPGHFNAIFINDANRFFDIDKKPLEFSKAIKEKSGSLSLPELVIIDGGKGQYSVSRETLNELGLHDLPILAVAKGKNRNAGEEKIYHKTKEYKLEKNDPLLFFIQRLRDEAHRFAISTHRLKRKKNLSRSLLDQINGIGKQRKRALLNHFGSARAVESASLDDLKSVEGIEDNIAKKIYDYFHE